jgi:hypothetical protein
MPLEIMDGGTSQSTAAGARKALGLEIGVAIQAWDADLDAISALAGTGIAVRTAANTWTTRTLQAPTAGFTITNPAGVAGDPTFVLANDLGAIEALNTNAILVRTTTDTWAARTLTAPAAGLTITNPAGTAGNPIFVLANDLAALEGLSSNGLVTRTATDTMTTRTITGTANEITATNGDGVSANPTLSLPSSLTFTGKTITGGTFSGVTLSSTTTVSGLLDVTNGQIGFPATQNASAGVNVLDDYEEGTWTPTYVSSTGAFGAITYNATTGTYTKIGNVVVVRWRIATDSLAVGTAGGQLKIGGLPFSSASSAAAVLGFVSGYAVNNPWSGITSGTEILLYHKTTITSNSTSTAAATDPTTGASANANQIIGSAVYLV